LTPGEKSILSLHYFILSVFEERFGKEAIIGVNLTPLVTESWITVLVNQRTQGMVDLANEIEREFSEDLGRHVHIFVKRPWKAIIRNLAREILPQRNQQLN